MPKPLLSSLHAIMAAKRTLSATVHTKTLDSFILLLWKRFEIAQKAEKDVYYRLTSYLYCYLYINKATLNSYNA